MIDCANLVPIKAPMEPQALRRCSIHGTPRKTMDVSEVQKLNVCYGSSRFLYRMYGFYSDDF